MPVIYQKWIFRVDLQRNRTVFYLFGDNEQREGLGGQAKEMRGEPNAIGVRTKVAPNNKPESFWREGHDPHADAMFRQMIDKDLERPIEHLRRGGILVIPLDGLGTGLSRLSEFAPQAYAHLNFRIEQMEKIRAG